MGKKKQPAPAPRLADRVRPLRTRVKLVGGAVVLGLAVVGALSLTGPRVATVATEDSTVTATCRVTDQDQYVCAPTNSPEGGELTRVTMTTARYDDGATFDQRTGKFR